MRTHTMLKFLLSAAIVIGGPVLSTRAESGLPSFPGAEGFGARTPGGRGGKVLFVDNLNATGPGSLTAATGARGPRIVIFRTGGIITLTEDLVVTNSHITIAGQTAPGDGISIRGAALKVNTHDVIVRNMRIRVGDNPDGPPGDARDGLGTYDLANRVVFDHCSASWAIDENIATWYGRNITFQWCLSAEALNNSIHPKGRHAYGMLVKSTANVTVHHSLFAFNGGRNPSCAGYRVELVNLVGVGNPLHLKISYDPNERVWFNVINCYYMMHKPIIIDKRLKVGKDWIYIKGTVCSQRPDNKGDEWLAARGSDQYYSPVPVFPSSRVTAQSPEDAADLVMEYVGAIAPRRDAVDRRIIGNIINKRLPDGSKPRKYKDINGEWNPTNQWQWLVNSQEEVGGWPHCDRGTPPKDSDSDGIPDTWEQQKGLDPKNPADGNKTSPSGYTWIEEYINFLLPRIAAR